MVLLASDFDKSRYFKAADIEGEKRLRIKGVTAEDVGTGADKENKLVVWFTNDERRLPVMVKTHFAKFSLTLALQSVTPGASTAVAER